MGKEDLSASIKYILDISNQKQWVPDWIVFILNLLYIYHFKIANTGSRPGHDYLLRDAGPTPGAGLQNFPHHLNGSHNLRSSHYRLTEALLSVSDIAAPLDDGWSQ